MQKTSEPRCLICSRFSDNHILCRFCEKGLDLLGFDRLHPDVKDAERILRYLVSLSRTKPDWDSWFLLIALAVSARGDCMRSRVGAVIVDSDHSIVSVGYNGAERGGPSCLQGDCPRASSDVDPGSSYDTGPGACIAVHAEANALLYAGRDRAKGATLYSTREPCGGCLKLIKACAIRAVCWKEGESVEWKSLI